MPVERLAFLAPMGDFSWYLDLFADKQGFGRRIRTGLRRRLDRRLNMPLYDTDISAVAPRINNPPPLVVVHDPDDPDSPYAMSEEIVGAWSGASLVTTRGLGRLAHYRHAAPPRDSGRRRFHRLCTQPIRRTGCPVCRTRTGVGSRSTGSGGCPASRSPHGSRRR